METSEIISIISIASGLVVAIFNIIILLVAIAKRKTSKTKEEQEALDEIINDQINLAIQNIKSVCNANNLMYNAKQTNKIAKKIIKEEQKQ